MFFVCWQTNVLRWFERSSLQEILCICMGRRGKYLQVDPLYVEYVLCARYIMIFVVVQNNALSYVPRYYEAQFDQPCSFETAVIR